MPVWVVILVLEIILKKVRIRGHQSRRMGKEFIMPSKMDVAPKATSGIVAKSPGGVMLRASLVLVIS